MVTGYVLVTSPTFQLGFSTDGLSTRPRTISRVLRGVTPAVTLHACVRRRRGTYLPRYPRCNRGSKCNTVVTQRDAVAVTDAEQQVMEPLRGMNPTRDSHEKV